MKNNYNNNKYKNKFKYLINKNNKNLEVLSQAI